MNELDQPIDRSNLIWLMLKYSPKIASWAVKSVHAIIQWQTDIMVDMTLKPILVWDMRYEYDRFEFVIIDSLYFKKTIEIMFVETIFPSDYTKDKEITGTSG